MSARARWPGALIDALELQQEVVDGVGPDELGLASPCEGWTVRHVLNHSIGVTRKFTNFARGATDQPHTPPGDLLAPDHQSALRAAVEDARTAWAAVDRRRRCRLPFGTFPAELAAGINLFDVLAHTWDLAAPMGVELSRNIEVWSVGLAAAREVIGPARDPRHYGVEVPVPEDAAAMTRFLAFLGRTPEGP